MTRPIPFVAILLVLVAISSCTDENQYITNVYQSAGNIYGQVVPAEPGTEVSAWQATMIGMVEVDAAGYFTIPDLDPGLYKVVIEGPSGLRREIPNVAVDWGMGTSLGVVALTNIPTPFLGFGPEAESEVDPAFTSIYLLSAERLSVASLKGGVTITPAVEGVWYEDSYTPQYFYYQFNSQEAFRTSTTYTVTIGSELAYYSGTAWNNTFSYSFRTVRFQLSNVSFTTQPVRPAFKGTLATLTFNSDLDTSTLDAAVTITPSFEYELQAASYPYEDSRVRINVVSGLAVGTDYKIVLGPSLKDVYGTSLDTTLAFMFSTEPLRVESAVFGYSGTVEPAGDLYVSLRFNDEVDPEALSVAARFSPSIEGRWYKYQSYSYSEARFLPAGAVDLVPDATYTLTIDGSVPLSGEATLGEAYEAEFKVEPVKVISSSPSNGATSVYRSTYCRLLFNIPMDRPLTEAAFKLETFGGTRVGGTFAWAPDNTSVEFHPALLDPSTSYEASLSVSAMSESGYALKEPWSIVFRTREN